MAAEPTILHLSPDDDLVIAVKRVAKDRELVIVETGEEIIEISLVSTRAAGDETREVDGEEPDAILKLIGILDSNEPSNIAELKDQYIAEAINPRER